MSESSVSFTLIYTTQSVKSVSVGKTSKIMWANRPQCRRNDRFPSQLGSASDLGVPL